MFYNRIYIYFGSSYTVSYSPVDSPPIHADIAKVQKTILFSCTPRKRVEDLSVDQCLGALAAQESVHAYNCEL
jgi:hypothetical protein